MPDGHYTACDGSTMANTYKTVILSLAFFHCTVMERHRFGVLGWNEEYSWNISDFEVYEDKQQIIKSINL